MKILLVPAELVDPHDQLSAITIQRCNAGLIAWKSGAFDYLLLTGGRFLPPERQSRSAAAIMRDWFVQHGVAEAQVLVEPESLDTYENIALGLEILERAGHLHAQITVLTQYQHALRFVLTFFLAHHRWIQVIPIRQPRQSWTSWFIEWLILIPCHTIDWRGRSFLARWNRKQRRLAAQLT